MHVAVLGAGVVGTAAAWYLAAAGHRVTVVDRQSAAGMETSFANGGQISASHAEPWANPQAPGQALRWIGREDAPLLFRARWDPALFAWSLRFLRQCTPGRTRANTRRILALALYSRDALRALRDELGLDYGQRTRGILHLFDTPRDFAAARHHAAELSEWGCPTRAVSREECLALEPALVAGNAPLAGGTYTESDESGDAHRFTQSLAAHAAARGVEFRYGCAVRALEPGADGIAAVRIDTPQGGARLAADAYVLALGSYSPLLAAPLGLRLPIYPCKGYSVSLPIADPARAPTMSLTDTGHKLVISRLGDVLRIAGTAEFAGYDTELNAVRGEAIVRRALELFPGVARAEEAQHWTGLRPLTPGNVPLVGRTRIPNLYLDTGHGSLGWTLACGSGRVLADVVSGHSPAVEV